jgi:hypothetical protein
VDWRRREYISHDHLPRNLAVRPRDANENPLGLAEDFVTVKSWLHSCVDPLRSRNRFICPRFRLSAIREHTPRGAQSACAKSDFPVRQPRYLSVYSLLEQTNEQLSELVVDATGSFSPIQSSIHWTLGITGFTGYLCEKSASAPSLVPLRGFPHDYEINDNSNIPVTSGQPFFVIKLCWDNGAPLITNGSYVSAALPPILAAPGQSGTVTRSLVLSGTSLSSRHVLRLCAEQRLSLRPPYYR